MSSSDAMSENQPPPRTRRRTWLFVLMVTILVAAAAGYVGWASGRGAPSGGDAAISPGVSGVLFQNLASTGHGQVAVAPTQDPDGPRRLSNLSCDRVHFAAGRGLCLAYGSGMTPKPHAKIFDHNFNVTGQVETAGLPSRARVSRDGRYGATTSFVSGHSYTDVDFSTSTLLIDMAEGRIVANLEQFATLRGGRPFTARDRNFWGVTFAENSNRFFATLRTGGRTYLVEGDIASRQLVVGKENVECPSLSPDGTRIGFKKRMNGRTASPEWRFHVLEVASGREIPLAETRSVDDQLEWLDDKTLLYGSFDASHAVMSVSADGTGEPRRFLSQAQSPTVLRTPLPSAGTTDVVVGPQKANLHIAIAASAEASLGDPLVQLITVGNTGPGDATRVFMDVALSGPGRIQSVEVVRSPDVDGSYGCGVMSDQVRARCDVERLADGVTWTIRVTVTPTAAGALDAEAVVTAAEPDPVSDDDRAAARTILR